MKFDNGNERSFFKVLRSESAKYIQVPTPFAEKYLEKSNNNKIQTIVLKTQSHVEWNVEFLKIKDGYYFTDGWSKFIKDNHLQKFDFLVFFLPSRSPKLTFEVFSYATNGCLKSLASPPCNFPTAEKENAYDDLSKTVGRQEKLIERVIKKSHIRQMPLTRRFVKAVGIEGPCYLKLQNDEGKIWGADLRIWGRHKIPFIAKGWADFMKDNKLNIGNRCDFSHVNGNMLRVHVIKRIRKSKRLHAPSTLRKLQVTDLESETAARKFNSDKPYYWVPIKDSYIRSGAVNVPAEFCRRYLTYDKKCVTCVLHSSDGENWGQVQCKEYRAYAKLNGKNWNKFSDENNLGVGDVCVFQLVNDIEIVLKVTILRG